MENHDLLQSHEFKPLEQFGFVHPFWTFQKDTLESTFFIVCLIVALSIFINHCLKNESSLVRFIVLKYVDSFKDLLTQTLKSAPVNHLAFIASLFTFILLCNTVQVFPGFEEPTRDINTTLALGIISFLYVQSYSIKVNGIKGYLAEMFEPFFLMFPLHLIGKFTSIISLSFRLFGNIFGGFVISTLYSKMLSGSIFLQTLGMISGANILMLIIFGMFEGVIQAFVFAMLTLTYLSMEIVHDVEEEHEPTNNKKVTS